MPFQMFNELFPDVAREETRSITIPPGIESDLPSGSYGFVEQYCNDRGCDCRRVYFSVICTFRPEILAVISWGWEDLAFYRNWSKSLPKNYAKELKGPILAPMYPTTDLSEPLLALCKEVLIQDAAYVDRIKRHYALFRKTVERPKRTSKYP